ncbi:hypothetical protein DM860_004977 [Cuscuta australis]|uniref:Pentacotripeptide-repeat region of PRORP domain-containing protein n=1 Tax=Cuscuta australis TaxID=267555 RepID=A0A328DPV0_9ASTE|nr:hypothetical protein DM860_004977 [Cuscuta australis]
MFDQGKEILSSVAVDDSLSKHPVSEIADLARENNRENPEMVVKLLDALFRVYVYHMKLKEAIEKMVDANVKITVYSTTMVIDGLCKMGRVDEARRLLQDMMIRRGVKPNEHTYNTLLNGYVKHSDLGAVNDILNEMKKEGIQMNTTSYTVLIEGYSKLRRFEEAGELFGDMEKRNIEADAHVYTAGMAIGIVGDAGVRANSQQSKLFVGS